MSNNSPGLLTRIKQSVGFRCFVWVLTLQLLMLSLLLIALLIWPNLWGRYQGITPLQVERSLSKGLTVSETFKALGLDPTDKSIYSKRHFDNQFQIYFNHIGYGSFLVPQYAYVFTFDANERLEHVLVETHSGLDEQVIHLNLNTSQENGL